MRKVWIFLPVILSLCLAVTGGFYLWEESIEVVVDKTYLYYDTEELETAIYRLENEMLLIRSDLEFMSYYLEEQVAIYESQRSKLQNLVTDATDYKELSDGIYEQKIISLLGSPIGFSKTKSANIMVFDFYKIDYRGYVAKVTPKKSDVIKVTLASDLKTGNRETTSTAATREDAILAINGGGFFGAPSNGHTVYLPLGNTMVDGELIGEFTPTYNDITFIGFTRNGSLIGGKYDTKKELLDSNAYAGVTFVPILIKDGTKAGIPSKWASTRQPRTIVGEYPNGDILFIVIDGRQSDWSSGVTLEEAQDVLLKLGIKEAYNLDGGGSTTMYFNGEVLNKPSDGDERLVTTNIIVK